MEHFKGNISFCSYCTVEAAHRDHGYKNRRGGGRSSDPKLSLQ